MERFNRIRYFGGLDARAVPQRGQRLEVALPDGTMVRVPQDNLAALTTILRVLRHGGTATCISASEASDA